MKIRNALLSDLDAVAALEALCFPAAEAAPKMRLREGLLLYPKHFWLAFEGSALAAFADGLCTDAADLADEMYADASLHDENGAWQMLFSVCTHPKFRGKGYAGAVLKRAAADCAKEGRKGLVLTCKEALIPFYRGFGFVNEGVSASGHGGALWYQMRLAF